MHCFFSVRFDRILEFDWRCNFVSIAIVSSFEIQRRLNVKLSWRLFAFFLSSSLSFCLDFPRNFSEQSKEFCCELLIRLLFHNAASMIYIIFIYLFFEQFLFRSSCICCMRLLLSLTMHLRINSLRTSWEQKKARTWLCEAKLAKTNHLHSKLKAKRKWDVRS